VDELDDDDELLLELDELDELDEDELDEDELLPAPQPLDDEEPRIELPTPSVSSPVMP